MQADRIEFKNNIIFYRTGPYLSNIKPQVNFFYGASALFFSFFSKKCTESDVCSELILSPLSSFLTRNKAKKNLPHVQETEHAAAFMRFHEARLYFPFRCRKENFLIAFLNLR